MSRFFWLKVLLNLLFWIKGLLLRQPFFIAYISFDVSRSVKATSWLDAAILIQNKIGILLSERDIFLAGFILSQFWLQVDGNALVVQIGQKMNHFRIRGGLEEESKSVLRLN